MVVQVDRGSNCVIIVSPSISVLVDWPFPLFFGLFSWVLGRFLLCFTFLEVVSCCFPDVFDASEPSSFTFLPFSICFCGGCCIGCGCFSGCCCGCCACATVVVCCVLSYLGEVRYIGEEKKEKKVRVRSSLRFFLFLPL